jgi:hypothetical protein
MIHPSLGYIISTSSPPPPKHLKGGLEADLAEERKLPQ